MKRLSLYFLIGGILCAVAAGFLAVRIFTKAADMVPVVVAVRDIPAYTVLKPEMLKVEARKISAGEKIFSSADSLADRYTRTLVPAGTPLYKSMLIDRKYGTTNPLTVTISDFKNPKIRAVALPVNKIKCVGGNVRAGDRVDIIGSFKLPIGGVQKPVVKIIARASLVLDILGDKSKPSGIILAVTPQEGQEMVYALSNGKIHLLLNPYDTDPDAAHTETTTPERFIKKYISDISKPSSQPPGEKGNAEEMDTGHLTEKVGG